MGCPGVTVLRLPEEVSLDGGMVSEEEDGGWTLVLWSGDGRDAGTARLAPLLRLVASDPRLRPMLEEALRGPG